jgi:hypothetical protein
MAQCLPHNSTTRGRVVPAARFGWALLAAAALAGAVLLAAGAWQIWVALVLPDIALVAGVGRGLERGQLHPRAVPLYNALHRLVGPALLALASIWLGTPWLAAALAWLAHIAIDRAVGYGLRDAHGFQRA